jgi:predicted  nucleic acid-binding Zn-ribbon protein
VGELQTQIASLKETMAKDHADYRTWEKELGAERDDLRKEVERLRGELVELGSEISSDYAREDVLEERDELAKERDALNATIRDLRLDIDLRDKDYAELQTEKQALEERLKAAHVGAGTKPDQSRRPHRYWVDVIEVLLADPEKPEMGGGVTDRTEVGVFSTLDEAIRFAHQKEGERPYGVDHYECIIFPYYGDLPTEGDNEVPDLGPRIEDWSDLKLGEQDTTAKLEKEIGRLKDREIELQAQVENVEAENKHLLAAAQHLKVDAVSNTLLEGLQNEVAELRQEVVDLRKQNERLKKANTKIKTEAAVDEASTDERIKKLQAQLRDARKRIKELEPPRDEWQDDVEMFIANHLQLENPTRFATETCLDWMRIPRREYDGEIDIAASQRLGKIMDAIGGWTGTNHIKLKDRRGKWVQVRGYRKLKDWE